MSMKLEKCIDGVWGRMVDEKFYTHIHAHYNCYLFRKIEINDDINSHYICRSVDDDAEWFDLDPMLKPVPYTPKVFKDLGNLERGDIVWVGTETKSQGKVWSPAVYLGLRNSGEYCCNEVFNADGFGLLETLTMHKEVFLKPPFSF